MALEALADRVDLISTSAADTEPLPRVRERPGGRNGFTTHTSVVLVPNANGRCEGVASPQVAASSWRSSEKTIKVTIVCTVTSDDQLISTDSSWFLTLKETVQKMGFRSKSMSAVWESIPQVQQKACFTGIKCPQNCKRTYTGHQWFQSEISLKTST